MYAGIGGRSAADAAYKTAVEAEYRKLMNIGFSGAVADIYKCVDQLIRELIYELLRIGGAPAKIIRELSDKEIGWKTRGTEVYHPLAQQHLATEQAVEPLAALRMWVALRPWCCAALCVITVAVELGAVLLLLPRWRRSAAVALITLHGGVALLMGFVYLSWMLLLLGVATSSLARPAAASPSPDD